MNPDSSFADAIEGAWRSYVGRGIESKGRRNAYLKAWGSVVGRERAMDSFDEFVLNMGGYEGAAEALELNVRTFRRLRSYFESLPSRAVKPMPAASEFHFVLNTRFDTDEDRQCEFKELRGADPAASIRNTADEYAVAFLNSDGGRILWGIRDSDHVIVSVALSDQQKDEIRRDVTNKLSAIRPHIATTSTRLLFHRVYGGENPNPERYVVELTVPQGDPRTLYFTGGHEAFVRLDGAKHKLLGPAIQAWIMERNSPQKTAEDRKAIYSEIATQVVREQEQAEQRRLEQERQTREAEAARKVAEINAEKRRQFLTGLDGFIAQILPHNNPQNIFVESRRQFPFVADAFGNTLAVERRKEFEQAIDAWRRLNLPPFQLCQPGPGQNNTLDYSAGNAALLGVLQRLRSFA